MSSPTQNAIIAILHNKFPGDKVTWKDVVKYIHYTNILNRYVLENYKDISDFQSVLQADVLREIGNLLNKGTIASDMELYIPGRV